MGGLDIKDCLIAWGEWSHDLGHGTCASPSQILINLAPIADADEGGLRVMKCSYSAQITDCEALMIDKAVAELKSRSERLNAILGYAVDNDETRIIYQSMLYQVIKLRFYNDLKSQDIANVLNRYFEKRIFNRINVEKLIERGMGFIEGQLMLDNAAMA